jgi:hypothetical protein
MFLDLNVHNQYLHYFSVETDDLLDEDLVTHFQKLHINESKICLQEFEQSVGC